jgi:hypothetical protein
MSEVSCDDNLLARPLLALLADPTCHVCRRRVWCQNPGREIIYFLFCPFHDKVGGFTLLWPKKARRKQSVRFWRLPVPLPLLATE